jgi:hypothetical protein
MIRKNSCSYDTFEFIFSQKLITPLDFRNTVTFYDFEVEMKLLNNLH